MEGKLAKKEQAHIEFASYESKVGGIVILSFRRV